MSFDVCEHRIRQIIIRAGELLREAKELPREKNITVLYNETAPLLGIIPVLQNSQVADHLPTPEDSAREHPELARICPKCGEKSYFLTGLCGSCKDAEGGKYKTLFECFKCKHREKSTEPLVVWLTRFDIDFKTQTKASLGIKTLTDEGLKE